MLKDVESIYPHRRGKMSDLRNRMGFVLGVLASLGICLLKMPFVHGTFTALTLTIVLQVYFPGYLLARILGRHQVRHPIVQFVWIMLCGLVLTILLGAFTRFLSIPVPMYLLLLHAIMVGLALCPVSTPAKEIVGWSISWSQLPLMLLVLISCAVTVGVNYESRNRFYGFEDQAIFISLIDWVATHPEVRPHDTAIRSRQIGVLNGDARMENDGWTYIQGAWVWTSGVSASQLVWYDLSTLFIWTIPLIHFALAYSLTKSDSVAAWSTVGLTIAGMLTLDNLVYNPTYTAFGRHALFQINVNRQAALSIFLPLGLLAGLTYLTSYRKRDLGMTLMSGLALAAIHPIPTTILVCSLGITAFLNVLVQPSLDSIKKLAPLAVVLVLLMALPLIQRFAFFGTADAPGLNQDTNSQLLEDIVILPELPILGQTYIRNPASFFYSPVIALVILIGLVIGVYWRQSIAARYVFGTTLVILFISFTPGLTALVDKLGSFITLLVMIFILPISLTLGMTIDRVIIELSRVIPTRVASLGASLFTILAISALLFEPFSITASARDQIRVFNDLQTVRLIHPAHVQLAESLRRLLPIEEVTILATPPDIANVIIEEVSGTLITGGRDQGINQAAAGNNRFFNAEGQREPWLDDLDLSFLEQFGVSHIIILADDTRSTQLRIQPERFKLLDSVNGYLIFQIMSPISPDQADTLFEQMNSIYEQLDNPRWGPEGFTLVVPGDTNTWNPLAQEWLRLLAVNPEDTRAQFGLALVYTLMGADNKALPMWETLYSRFPDIPIYADAIASTRQHLAPGHDTLTPLIQNLSATHDETQILAARRLLTDTFFYLLNGEQLQRVIQVTEQHPTTWDLLANFDQPEEIRKRVALLMDRQEWVVSERWLETLPRPWRSPEDFIAQAALRLVAKDVMGALEVLEPLTDPDQYKSNAFIHPDRWEENTASTAYHLLSTDLAEHGQNQTSTNDIGYQSMLPIANSGSIYVMDLFVNENLDEELLTITATYGSARPRNAFPITTWRIEVTSLDSQILYARQDIPAINIPGELITVSEEVVLNQIVPELTPVLVMVQPRYNDVVTSIPEVSRVVINRPIGIEIPPGVVNTDIQFMDSRQHTVVLQGYSVEWKPNQLQVDLYWYSDAPLSDDYQVFVHVVDSTGNIVAQRDSGPMNNRYPTSQWLSGATILDRHILSVDENVTESDYKVFVGLYKVTDLTRLSVVTTDGIRAQDNAVWIHNP